MSNTIPFGLFKGSPDLEPIHVLAADVGGTKTHLGMFQYENGEMKLLHEAKYSSTAYESFEEMVEDFAWSDSKPDAICVAFAGIILHGTAKATNFSWKIDVREMSKAFGVDRVFLINDLEAHAYGLFGLDPSEFMMLQEGDPNLKGNAAIIAPGTGLGEAGLFWDGQFFYPFSTEGGHCDFAPRDELDDRLLVHLRKRFGHVSWERLISGMGISEIYEYLRERDRRDYPDWWFREKDKGASDAELISLGAENGNELCGQTMSLFFKYLAVESANLAVKLKTTGGLYIAGGIVPKNLKLLDLEFFLSHFHDQGRFTDFLQQIPVHIVLNDKTALLGAAYAGAFTKL